MNIVNISSQRMKTQCFNLSQDMGLIQIKGSDTFNFLQGLLTCDIHLLENNPYIMGAFCNLKGRIRALFKIFKNENDILLQTPRNLIPVVMPALKRHAMFSKIVITEVSNEYQQWGYLDNSKNLQNIQNTNNRQNRSIIILPLQSKISDQFPNFFYGDFNEWILHDIREGIPEIWPETTEKFLPHYLNLPKLGAVSFTKGCYCGQEIIARMEYKANIKYELKHIILSKEQPNIGEETKFGTIVSIAKNQNNEFEAIVIAGSSVL